MIKLAAALIVKGTDDEAPLLEACLKNLKPHVDQFFIDINAPKGKKVSPKVVAVAKKYKTDYKETVWENNFSKARNENFARVPKEYDFILWVDSDDTIENPEKIKEVCAITPKSIDGIYVKYDYATDEYGNVTVSHWVARVVRNNDSFAWKSSFEDGEVSVHETLNERRRVGKAMADEFWIVHHADEDRRDRSLIRNIELLEGMLNANKQTPDARILYYLATHYVDANRGMEAKELLEWYLQLSGWAEERSQAYVFLGIIYDALGEPDNARGCYMRAVSENPNDPNPYVELGELELREKLFQKAIYWLDMAVAKKLDPTASVYRPMDNTYRAYKLLAEAHVNLNGTHLKDASKWLTKAQKLRPFDPELEEAQKLIDELTEIRDLTKATNQLLGKIKKEDDLHKIVPFLNSLPASLQDNPLVTSARSYYSEPKVWPKKSIVIVCGWGPLGNWGPEAINKGVGGSEEAVIRISKQLKDLGYSVTIFGTPGEEAGTHDGIEWKHYWEINMDDTFDIFMSWRSPEQFDKKIKARKNYLWLHDVMDKEEFIPERLANIDRILFVSQYHRDLYPFIPEELCFVSGNGISPEDFEAMDGKFERNPHRVIYMSSHVRGLELIYNVWPNVKKKVPDAILDAYYGWGSYDAVNKSNPERMAWKDKMIQMESELEDVTDHGKISQTQIVEEIFKSGVWAYPCPFPEVYCHPAGTKVMTEFGEKNIEELLLTDRVLTHRGVLKPIYQTMRRKADTLIKLSVRSGDDLLLTPNHPVYTKRNGEYVWVEAGELTQSDVLLTPAELLETDYSWVNQSIFYIKDENTRRANNLPTEQHTLPEKLTITPKLAKFFGYFAGDGNANERGKVSVLVADRHPEHEQIVLDGFAELGLTPDIAQKQGCKEYRVYSYELARAFRKYFYDGKKKKLPLAWATMPEVLEGLLAADGHCKNGYNYGFTNTSDRLIGWVKIALAIRGYSGKAQKRVHKVGKDSWTISWTQEGKLPQYTKQGRPLQFIEKKIKAIDVVEHNDWVYNIEVEDDHSYVSNGSVVHNCITGVKAQAGGAVPVASNFAALDETVQFGTKLPMKAQDERTPVGQWDKEELQKFEDALVDMLLHPEKQEEIRTPMMAEMRKHSWKRVATQWIEDFEK